MNRNYFYEWVDELSDNSVLYLVNVLWGENDFNSSNSTYLRKCFKISRRVYEYYMNYIVIGD